MVTFTGHILPGLIVLGLWFASTALVVWLANRARTTYRISLAIAGGVGIAGLVVVALTADDAGPLAAYASFAGSLAIWGWHELAFLTGAVAGPRRESFVESATGWQRFTQASATLIHHEVALALTAILLLTLTAGSSNTVGATAFALLFVLRLSAKLNIHLGVPNLSDELLPAHLGYLKSYFRRRPLAAPLALSVAATFALAGWLGARVAIAPPAGGESVAASLLFALAALGALEHLFLALPLGDGALWRWARPGGAGTVIKGGHYGL
jgi:putative photosynthetic complex assembly protein 2